MYKDNDFVYEAIAAFEEITKLSVSINSIRQDTDVMLEIENFSFYGLAKRTGKRTNYSLITNVIENKDFRKNTVIIADYLTQKTSNIFRENSINYIDAAGNCFIKTDQILILVDGRRRTAKEKTTPARAFQETGLKLLLVLISDPEALQLSYRALAEKTGISLGSVSNVLEELEKEKYLLRTKNKRVMRNREELLERWVISYKDILQPRCFRKKMKAVVDFDIDTIKSSNELDLFFGGEPGGQILTNQLIPKDYIIYTNEGINELAKKMKLVPSEDGNILIYEKFWTTKLPVKKEHVAPPLVVYADLINSGNERNIETAKLILADGL